MGIQGNEFVLNGKLQDVNAEEIYGPLTIPVFGSDVVYDCPNSKLMEQKKFVKFGLTQKALEAHVPLIEKEVQDYIKGTPAWKGSSGVVDISAAMSEITLFTAARSLQGKEVRQKLTANFAKLYHDLDMVSLDGQYGIPLSPAVSILVFSLTYTSNRAFLRSTSSSLDYPYLEIAVETPPTAKCAKYTWRLSISAAHALVTLNPSRT